MTWCGEDSNGTTSGPPSLPGPLLPPPGPLLAPPGLPKPRATADGVQGGVASGRAAAGGGVRLGVGAAPGELGGAGAVRLRGVDARREPWALACAAWAAGGSCQQVSMDSEEATQRRSGCSEGDSSRCTMPGQGQGKG